MASDIPCVPPAVCDVADDEVERPLKSDSAFSGLLATQFLGAFNDNYFKQMVLLKCTELAVVGSTNLQPLALAAFALPFVLFSGFGGCLSDRYSKRTIIVWCKVAEIAVMAASLVVLMLSGLSPTGQLKLLIVVLGFMGAQSAFFGPSKYGILPELFRHRQLLPVNGAIQMTTFLAIIFGTAIAGVALDHLGNSLWLCSMVAILIAVIGTATALLVRHTPVARPGLPFEPGNLFIPKDVRRLFRQKPSLFAAMLVMSLFWFIGGAAQPGVNNLGELTLQLSKTRTSLLAASIGVGIAFGCVVAGFANKGGRADGTRWTTRGSWMIVGSLLLIALLGSGVVGQPPESRDQIQGLFHSLAVAAPVEWLLRLSMFLLGMSAGFFVIPIQVYIQEAPPAEQKGRLIGAMNVMTWIGILISAGFLWVTQQLIDALAGSEHAHQHQYATFLALAVLMIPVALFYRLPTDDGADKRAD